MCDQRLSSLQGLLCECSASSRNRACAECMSCSRGCWPRGCRPPLGRGDRRCCLGAQFTELRFCFAFSFFVFFRLGFVCFRIVGMCISWLLRNLCSSKPEGSSLSHRPRPPPFGEKESLPRASARVAQPRLKVETSKCARV